VDNNIPSSITNLDGGNTWKIKRVKIGSTTYSLSQIENSILIGQFGEGRIHFAINCAAKSCPPLWNRAFNSDNVQSMLTQRAREFINNPKYNTIKKRSAELSKIFEWYAKDFGNDIIAYINKYSAVQMIGSAKVSYREYDWALNN